MKVLLVNGSSRKDGCTGAALQEVECALNDNGIETEMYFIGNEALPISGSLALARPLHIVSSFWGYVLMAMHLGLHWNTVLAMLRKATGATAHKPQRSFLRMAAVLVAGFVFLAHYGVKGLYRLAGMIK